MAKQTLGDRLRAKLQKLGMSERKAKEFAKGLLPTVRAAIKATGEVKAPTPRVVDQDYVAQFTKKPVKVDGHSLLLNKPVVPMSGMKGIELLRVMDGLSSTATYLVAAVKSDEGILAIRQLSPDTFNVKFYPSFQYWDKTPADLEALGGKNVCTREHYQRMHFSTDALDGLLTILHDEAKPRSRMKQLVDRFLTVATKPLLTAFGFLQKSKAQASV